jgi:hypothetical protein
MLTTGYYTYYIIMRELELQTWPGSITGALDPAIKITRECIRTRE